MQGQNHMRAQRDFANEWLQDLYRFRDQGMRVTDVNPVSALADMIGEQLYDGAATIDDLRQVLDVHAATLWQERVADLRRQSGLDGETGLPDLSGVDISRPIYRAVFTAHPVFALRREASGALCAAATSGKAETPKDAFAPRDGVTLDDEHAEAMHAVRHARHAVNDINADILRQRRSTHADEWRDTLPGLIGVSTWVGYDLDGRSDISWIDSFCLRLREKVMALTGYIATIESLGIESIGLSQLDDIAASLKAELHRVELTLAGFETVEEGDFTSVINDLTGSGESLVSSKALARDIHVIAQGLGDDAAMAVMELAADVAMHGFGMGEVHLRINAAQIRNAMRPVDGRAVSVSDGAMSSRMLIERLATRIRTEAPWQINFANLDAETATARRQLMLATQILKYIDSDQPIRLLIAECERPITIMSALYLAHKFNIADNLDISPLFETGYGLEHGDKVIDQLLQQSVFVDYVRRRGRLAIQTGFSDAGRFVGQIAANMAIERLQLTLLRSLHNRIGKGVDLLIFNTHGESLGRGGMQAPMVDRQAWLMTPYVRHQAATLGVGIYHQSSFQGGDGYRLFGTPGLAASTMRGLLAAEAVPPAQGCVDDAFYRKTDFSLDLFLELKIWHEALVADPNYGDLIDLFGSNLLPPTGSRPTKRVVQAGGERRGPSRIRAIAHNAILQQVGFLANVISGMGRAATVDIDEFVEIHRRSPRLRQCLDHVLAGKQLGSLNTVLAYCRLADPGFWVNRAYHGKQQRNQRALRRLAQHLRARPRFRGIQQTVWALRDDLVDLYRLVDKVGGDNARVTGERRGALDLLHAIRLAVITDSLMVICRTPNLGESNQYSNDDILALGLSLDFAGVAEIIRDAFSRKQGTAVGETLNESETYSGESSGNFAAIEREILAPLQENQVLIDRITQMVSAHYGAHG
jgi:phosphoenolpyruvate carboxylase